MKIITVLNNYDSHSESSPWQRTGGNPEWVFLPDSAMMRSGNPFFIPDLTDLFQGGVSHNCMAFPSIALKIGRLGKSIETRFGNRYLTQGALCVNFIAVDILKQRQEAGAPWTEAMAFDRSFACSDFIPVDLSTTTKLTLECRLIRNGKEEETMEWNLNDMILSAEEMLSRISRMNTMKMGDLLIPGVPDRGIEIHTGDTLTVAGGEFPTLQVNIK